MKRQTEMRVAFIHNKLKLMSMQRFKVKFSNSAPTYNKSYDLQYTDLTRSKG